MKRDGTILSGHRRYQAAKELGWKEITVIYKDDFSSNIDEEEYLIEANRYRTKTIMEIAAEASKLEQIYSERAKLVQKAGGTIPSEGPTSKKIAEAIGIGSSRQYEKIKTIIQAAADNPNIAQKLEKIDSGETSIHAVYQSVMELKKRETSDFTPKVYNVWTFDGNDERFGQPHPGRIPGQIVENLLYYYTKPGDLVIDPFGGGGVTIDVCKLHNRRYIVTDVSPKRDDIAQWDVSKGMPCKDELASFIFLDPPYWNQEDEGYSDESCSRMELPEFIEFLHTLLKHCYDGLKPGGYFALIITTQLDRLPELISYIDWPFLTFELGIASGFIPIQRISRPWSTSCYAPFTVSMAQLQQRMLGILGDIIVMQKPR